LLANVYLHLVLDPNSADRLFLYSAGMIGGSMQNVGIIRSPVRASILPGWGASAVTPTPTLCGISCRRGLVAMQADFDQIASKTSGRPI
jgi:hypothetical protein